MRSNGKGIPGLLVLQTWREKNLVDGASVCQARVPKHCGWGKGYVVWLGAEVGPDHEKARTWASVLRAIKIL